MEVRIDKWLWATRIFKTRTIALEACKKNRIMVNNALAKPSRMIRIGDVISVRKPPVTYSFKVLGLTSNRVGAKLVPEYFENITPPEQYEILNLQKINGFVDRAKGTGRPTKKERRNLDEFSTPTFIDNSTFDFDE
ncbi:heat-shock protein Hsp15 [Bacteroidia bacterium]|nr:heat-shock protein Hsp15 [Bacteroidia bacterium]